MTTWMDVIKIVASGVSDDELPPCPKCSQAKLDYLYVGSPSDRIGYLVVWCEACRNGTRISRAQAPPGANFMTFDEADERLLERVPTFREVPLR
jgi:hypothetical protein